MVHPTVPPVLLQTVQTPELPGRLSPKCGGSVAVHDPLRKHAIAALWADPRTRYIRLCASLKSLRVAKETQAPPKCAKPETRRAECPIHEAIPDDLPRVYAGHHVFGNFGCGL